MRVMSWLGTGKADGLSRSPRSAAWLSPLRAASLPVCAQAMRRGGRSMIALAVIALPAASAALASAAAPNWTRQTPATSPLPRTNAAMAYDAAAGTIVLFGGRVNGVQRGDTWTWDG